MAIRSLVLGVLVLPLWLAGCATPGQRLYQSSRSGDLKRSAALLAEGADPNYRTDQGVTPLMMAALGGHLDVAKALLAKKADVNAREVTGASALHGATFKGYLELSKLLIDNGAEVEAKTKAGISPLMNASNGGNVELVRLLLEKGADASARIPSGEGSLHNATQKGFLEVSKLLIDKGADINAQNKDGIPPLMNAVDGGHIELVRLLLAKGADVNARTATRGVVLHAATFKGHHEIVKLLIDNGADVNAQEKNGISPLMNAANAGSMETVALLLEKGADANALAANGGKALGNAQAKGYAGVAQLLTQAATKSPQNPGPKADAQGALPAAKPAVASDVDQPRYHGAENPDNFALVIGIEKYSGDLPDAEFAERDADAVRSHLLALGFPSRNIAFLTGPKASMGAIKKEVETRLPNRVNENSTVFVYYSGHGSPDPVSGQAYLVPWDGDPQYLRDTAYSLKTLYERLNALKAKHTIVALDSCFSGQKGRSVLARGVKPLVQKVDLGMVSSGRVVSLSASGGGQISGTLQDQGHGTFTYYLLKGINGAAADAAGSVTLAGLYRYLAPKVEDAASQDNREQTPQLFPPTGEATAVKLR